jgi:2-dehydropantoate 2-reductase
MRIGVIGAGAIGGAIAALLARGGHEIEVAARGDNLSAIAEHGIRLSGVWGDFAADVGAAETLTRQPGLVFVATKAQDAAAAIEANRDFLHGIPVVVVQNGLESVTSSVALLPDSRVLGALALYASSLVAPGEIAVGTAGLTYLGGGDDAVARRVADILNAVMPTRAATNFVGAQWTKLVINQVNALPAITGMSVQDVIADGRLRRIMTRSMRENVRVGLRSGIVFAEVQGLTSARLGLLARAPIVLGQALPRLMSRRMGAIPNPGSTLQSIRRGALTEIDYLNGAVVAAAAEIGMTAPVNAVLVDLVHEVEHAHAFLSPREVVARVAKASR